MPYPTIRMASMMVFYAFMGKANKIGWRAARAEVEEAWRRDWILAQALLKVIWFVFGGGV